MPEQSSPSNAPHFVVKGQYIKDLSFENPGAPQSLLALEQKPNIEVGVDLRAQKLQEGLFELTLRVTAKASADVTTLFLVELSYAGIFQLTNFPADTIESVILVDCPFVLFPFARRVIADVTRDGGFPPLMLDPIDFHSLYMQNKQNVQKGAE